MKAEKEEIAEEPFVIRPYLKSELAHLYNPYVPLVYAMRKMREWIRNNKELYDAMYSGGEGKNDHAYSARQVDRKSTRLNSSHKHRSRMPSSA